MRLIGIIDVGIGNLGSIKSAVNELGFDVCLVKEKSELERCSSLILPGVGSFSHGIKNIRNSGLIEPIQSFVADGKPLLGICLGMQLLFEKGFEGGVFAGLGLLPGEVRKFNNPSLYLPHVGWNNVALINEHKVWKGVKRDVDFYFVHSYRVECESVYVIGTTEYDETFPSVVSKRNVIGMQFHPEKSQSNGLRLLENFCLWSG